MHIWLIVGTAIWPTTEWSGCACSSIVKLRDLYTAHASSVPPVPPAAPPPPPLLSSSAASPLAGALHSAHAAGVAATTTHPSTRQSTPGLTLASETSVKLTLAAPIKHLASLLTAVAAALLPGHRSMTTSLPMMISNQKVGEKPRVHANWR
ncbi:hypothetical protein B0J12DRAFT_682571 [Macrophomina phaseolina]|uniref:Uncharacterized protein n=1 Tax=Macrophomina phaseolina TaxID=35725 RepID=A0ABQ8FVP9_9PEZI|nr:hypothetical protein B0J12DRAFT_682571 [Macrophomina phaseolina]